MSTVVFVLKDVKLDMPRVLQGIYDQLAQAILQSAGQAIHQALQQHVDESLRRAPYVRRKHAAGTDVLCCQRCGSRQRRHFSRNGYRERGWTLAIGHLQIALPRVRCQCGGSVRLNWPALPPGQRLGTDCAALIEHWSALGCSLRQIKAQLDAGISTSFGLRSLSARLHQLAAQVPAWQARWLKDVPPVVMLDAIWVTLLETTEQEHTDRSGRQRRVKARRHVPVMLALGVWPETGRSAILDFEIGDGPGEDRASWLRLLNRLEARGLRPECGLQLFVHDGCAALIAALEELFPDVPRQRCVFHKLRNLLRAIVPPAQASPEERRTYVRGVLRQAARIWQAPTYEEALRRYQRFRQRWRDEQPDLVATLERDFTDTLTFYHVWNRNRLWALSYLRTTSRLERTNRVIRRRLRCAGAYHSREGLQAMLAQELIPT